MQILGTYKIVQVICLLVMIQSVGILTMMQPVELVGNRILTLLMADEDIGK